MNELIKKPISKLTKDEQEQKNLVLMFSKNVLRYAALPLYSGNVTAAFNNYLGLTPGMLARWGIPGQIITLFMVLLNSLFGDKIKNRVRAYAILSLFTAIAGVGGLVLALGPESFREVHMALIITMIFGIIGAFTASPYAVVDATIECRTVHNEIRGRFWSIWGIASGVVGLLVGLFTTFILKQAGVRYGYAICCGSGLTLVIISTFLVLRLKELPDLQNPPQQKKETLLESLQKVIGMKQFRVFMPANFLRGIGDGCGGWIMLLALRRMTVPDEYTGWATTLGQISLFVAYIILGATMDRFGAGWVLPITEIAYASVLMGLVTINHPTWFLVVFFLYQVIMNVEASAIPLAHYDVLPVNVMGSFTAIRLGLLSITGAFAGTVIGILLDKINPVFVFAFCGIIKLIAGGLYSYGVFSMRKHIAAEKAAAEAAAMLPQDTPQE